MGKNVPLDSVQGPTLDVQVLQGLETYIATDEFLHKLEHASAEWIDLSEHQHLPHGIKAAHDTGVGPMLAFPNDAAAGADTAAEPPPAASSADNPFNTTSSGSTGIFTWGRSFRTTAASSQAGCAHAAVAEAPPANAPASSGSRIEFAGQPAACTNASSPASISMAASVFEVVEPQPPLHQDIAQQEPFVLVSAEDAIEGMAHYIALYLSRAPEARYMEPKQLQAALKQTFTAIRRSRYKVVWDLGRCLYRWGAVSYSALQLYEHPWLVRAVLAAIWTSSKMAFGLLV